MPRLDSGYSSRFRTPSCGVHLRRLDGYWLIVEVRMGSFGRGSGRAFTSSGATRDLRKLWIRSALGFEAEIAILGSQRLAAVGAIACSSVFARPSCKYGPETRTQDPGAGA